MDKDTKQYRIRQFEKVLDSDSEYRSSIKVIKQKGETNWLGITEKELQQIKKILTT